MDLLSKELKLTIIQEFLNRSMGDIQEDQKTINRLVRFTEIMDGDLNFTTKDSLHVYSRTLRRNLNEWRLRLSDVNILGRNTKYNEMSDKIKYVSMSEFYDIFARVPLIFLDGVKVNDSDVRIFIGNDKGTELLISDKYDMSFGRIDIVILEPSVYSKTNLSTIHTQGRHEAIGFYEDASLISSFTTANSLVVEGDRKNTPKYIYASGNLNQYLELKSNCKGYFSAYDCITDNNILVFEDGILLEPSRLVNKNNTVFKVEEFKENSTYRIFVFNKDDRVNTHITLSLFREGYSKMEEFYISNYEMIDDIRNMDITRYRDEYNIKTINNSPISAFIENMFKFISEEFTIELAIILGSIIPTNNYRFSNIRITPEYIETNTRLNTYDDVWGTKYTFDEPRLRLRGLDRKFNIYINGKIYKDYISLSTGYDDIYIYIKDFKAGDNISLEYYDYTTCQNRINVYTKEATTRPSDIVVTKENLGDFKYTTSNITVLAKDLGGQIVDSESGDKYSILPITDVLDRGNFIDIKSDSELRHNELVIIIEPEILRLDFKNMISEGRSIFIPNILPRHLYSNDKSYILSEGKMLYEDRDFLVNMEIKIRGGVPYTEIYLLDDEVKSISFYYDINRRVVYDEIAEDNSLVYIKDIIKYTSDTHRIWVDGYPISSDKIRPINAYTINIADSRYKRVHIEAYYDNAQIFDNLKETYLKEAEVVVGDYDVTRSVLYRLCLWSAFTGNIIDLNTLISNQTTINQLLQMIEAKDIDINYIYSIPDSDLKIYNSPTMDTVVSPPPIEVEIEILESLKSNNIRYLSKEDLDLLFRSMLLDRLFESKYVNITNPWGTMIDDPTLSYLYVGENILLDMTDKPKGTIEMTSDPILLDFSDTSNYRAKSIFRNQGVYEGQLDENKFYGSLSEEQKQNIINIYILRSIINGDIEVDDRIYSMIVDNILPDENILLDLNMHDSIYYLCDDGSQLLDLEYNNISFYPDFPDYELYLQSLIGSI